MIKSGRHRRHQPENATTRAPFSSLHLKRNQDLHQAWGRRARLAVEVRFVHLHTQPLSHAHRGGGEVDSWLDLFSAFTSPHTHN